MDTGWGWMQGQTEYVDMVCTPNIFQKKSFSYYVYTYIDVLIGVCLIVKHVFDLLASSLEST